MKYVILIVLFLLLFIPVVYSEFPLFSILFFLKMSEKEPSETLECIKKNGGKLYLYQNYQYVFVRQYASGGKYLRCSKYKSEKCKAGITVKEIANQTKFNAVTEEGLVPLQRKAGNEILAAGHVTNESNEDGVSASSDVTKKKEITWSAETYMEKMTLQNLGVRSASWMLERKASVGPCYKPGMLFGEPSGISICLPKKQLKHASSVLDNCKPIKSGISFVISGRCSDNKSRIYGPVQFEMRRAKISSMRQEEDNMKPKMKMDDYSNYRVTLRGKLDNFCGRVKHVLHI